MSHREDLTPDEFAQVLATPPMTDTGMGGEIAKLRNQLVKAQEDRQDALEGEYVACRLAEKLKEQVTSAKAVLRSVFDAELPDDDLRKTIEAFVALSDEVRA